MLRYEDFRSKLRDVQEYEGYMSGRCPFHSDSSPSLLVYKNGWFRCLGCSRNGTWKTLWNRLGGQPISPVSEVRTSWNAPRVRTSDMEEIAFKAHNDLLKFPTLGWYLEMRGLEDCIESCELGYWNGWYTIPIRDRNDEFVTTIFRAAPHVQAATGMRYWGKHDPVMYSPRWRDVKNGKLVTVVYGIFDSMVLSMMGYPCITPTLGMINLHPDWLDDVRKMIYVIPDKGEERPALNLAGGLGWRGKVVYLDYPEGIKDPAGFMEKGRRNELEAQLVSRVKGVS